MKIYRFLNWSKSNKDGSFNEFQNHQQLGLISPSYEYLWKKPHVLNEGINTFPKEHEMFKYFFLSLTDTLRFISDPHFGSNTIIEIDIPNEILKRYIGVGFYGRLYVEFRIPYGTLYDATAIQKLNYIKKALEFYNRNLYRRNLPNQKGYQELESLLTSVPYKGIIHNERISIYPLFCFEARATSITIQQESFTFFQQITDEISKNREKKYNYNQRISNLIKCKNYLLNFDKGYSHDDLLDYTSPILEEENEKLKDIIFEKDDTAKRTLTQ